MHASSSPFLVAAALLFSCGPGPGASLDDLGSTGPGTVASADAGPAPSTPPDAGTPSPAGGGAGGGAGTGGGAAGGTGGGSGGGGSAPVSTYSFLFANLNIAPRTVELVSDGQGVLHAVFKMLSPLDTILDQKASLLFYARCAANCGQPGSWARVQVGTGFDPQLAVGPGGAVHVVFGTDGGFNAKDTLRYARCLSDCLTAGSWSSAALFTADYGVRVRGRRALQLAPNGALATAFTADGDLYYADCYLSCLDPGAWSRVLLDDVAGETEASVALTSTGRPRVIASLEDSFTLRYFSCDQGCSAAPSWSRTSLYAAAGTAAVLRLDALDHPRVVFNQGSAGAEAEKYRAWFVGCDSNCATAANWTGTGVGAVSDGQRGVDLQFVDGKPLVALETRTGSTLLRCTGGCATRTPTFSATPLETDAELTALTAPPNLQGCTGPVWNSGRGIAVAVDPTGKHLTALFEAISITHCGPTGTSFELAADVLRVFDLKVP